MGAVNTTYTFTATDTITSTKMNNIIDQTTMTSDAVFTNGTIEVSSGKLRVASGKITSNELATQAVATDNITNGSVTPEKLSAGKVDWGSNYTDIGFGASSSPYYLSITPSRASNGTSVLQFGTQSGVNTNASITRESGENGRLFVTQNGTGDLIIENNNGQTYLTGPNGFKFYKDASNFSQFPVPAGTAPIFGIRAWVSFDMLRDASGASNTLNTNRFIYASGNVSSVLKTDTGRFQINFSTGMPDTSYIYQGSGRSKVGDTSGDVIIGRPNLGSKTNSSIVLDVLNSGGSKFDSPEVCVSIIR